MYNKWKAFIRNKGSLKIGRNIRFNFGQKFNFFGKNIQIVVKSGGKLTIGKNVDISNSFIFCANSINIEDGVLIGGDCKIWDTNFHSLDPKIRGTKDDIKSALTAPIKIKKNAFIGACSIIS